MQDPAIDQDVDVALATQPVAAPDVQRSGWGATRSPDHVWTDPQLRTTLVQLSQGTSLENLEAATFLRQALTRVGASPHGGFDYRTDPHDCTQVTIRPHLSLSKRHDLRCVLPVVDVLHRHLHTAGVLHVGLLSPADVMAGHEMTVTPGGAHLHALTYPNRDPYLELHAGSVTSVLETWRQLGPDR